MVVADVGSIIFRLRGGLELTCQLDSTDGASVQQAVSGAFKRLCCKVRSESLVLCVRNSPLLIWPNKGVLVIPDEVKESTPCKDIQQHIQAEENDSGKKSSKKKDKKNATTCVINMDLMMEVTEPSCLSATVLTSRSQKQHFVRMTLPVDCVASVRAEDSVGAVSGRLVGALCDQLADMEKVVLQHMKGTALLLPQPFHFLLPEPSGLVTVVYPAGVPDSRLELTRKELHSRFELPEDRPCFRRANAFHFPDEPYKDGYLRNPHAALNLPNMEGVKPYQVQGIYSYHHYMQDHVDDNGWGCAYRSLQTICSWFQQQGYVEREVPSHREIQQALVDVGDKPASFLGSRQWIGSIEVQVVLDKLLGVTSKILFVSQGSDLASKGRELANHFQTEGTPIMIGGGVLAHTILGVLWSETTGQIKFLILDPHYTGGEDLQVITDKGWCGWKGPEFWDQNAYYNLCMPQRPKTI
ncbi:hypothetical protein ANANG_G00097210 [Anguilla anguilla]|uniref:Ufm1-specific protease 2 n=1 Tax=Anguilla anguilla TaxID=7936 RepID=A0A9D3MI36_ANGAN|nr:hypothetical protein ANANG_G00097210 [Anguilla anguilla]